MPRRADPTIGRRRGSGETPASDLPSRAQAALRVLGEDAPRASGGLAGFVARALRLRRPQPISAREPGIDAADAGQLRALREELTRELGRVASRQASDGPDSDTALESAEPPGRAS